MKAAEERATAEHAKLEAGVAEAATALAALEETVGTLQQAHEEFEARINAALRDTIEDHCRRSFTIAGEPEAAARGGVAGYRTEGALQPPTTDTRQHNHRISGREVQEGASCL